jgi:hypothetical protein
VFTIIGRTEIRSDNLEDRERLLYEHAITKGWTERWPTWRRSTRFPTRSWPSFGGGFLEVASEEDDKKTVRLDIPSLSISTAADDFTSYTLIWIHPDYNAEFCHYYLEKPGDLPNFYVAIHSPNAPDNQVDDLNTVDDLVDWLDGAREAKERFSIRSQ